MLKGPSGHLLGTRDVREKTEQLVYGCPTFRLYHRRKDLDAQWLLNFKRR